MKVVQSARLVVDIWHPAGEPSPSQHGLSDQMEAAAKEWFTAGPHEKVKFEMNLMIAPGPLGKQRQHQNCTSLLCHFTGCPMQSLLLCCTLCCFAFQTKVTGCAESSDQNLGEEICAMADKLEARAVVLLHHGKGMMKEMMFGSITSFATRNCRRPLVVYYP